MSEIKYAGIGGTWNPKMIVIAEFPSLERTREWYRSPEYARALEVRDQALSRNLILVEGMYDVAAIVMPSERRRDGD